MSDISQLSPALSLALLHFTDGYDSSQEVYRNMLKATFFELLLGRVLVASTEKKLFAKVTYISRGPAFDSHRFKPHQLAFQSSLPKTRKMKDYIRKVYRRAEGGFADVIKSQLQELGLIVPVSKKALFVNYKGWALSPGGYDLQRRLQMTLDDGQRFAAYGYQIPPVQLQQYTAYIGLNIVLLASFSPLLMQQWNSILARMPRQGGHGTSSSDSGSYGDIGDDSFGYGWIGSFGDSDFSAGFEGAFESGGSGSDWSGDGGGDAGGDSGGDGGDGGGD